MPSTKTKVLRVLGGFLAVGAVVTGGFILLQLQNHRMIPATQSKTTPPTLASVTRVPAKLAVPVEQDKAKPGEQVRAALNNSETRLGDLARMRGQKHLLEQQVKIAELEQKLKETLNAIAPTPEIVLPPLEPPAEKPQETKPAAGPVVLSVQGVGGKLSATIRTSSGEVVTVEHGGRFGGGVLHVTRDRVWIRTDTSTRVVPFKE